MKKLIFIVMLAVILAGCQGGEEPTGESVQDTPSLTQSQTVAVVNGEEITQSEVDAVMKSAQQSGQQVDESTVVEQLVSQKLLMQEAENRGISVSDEEIEEQLSAMLSQRGQSLESVKQQMPEEQYQQVLEQQKQQFVIQELASQVSNASVTDEQARSFYEENKQQMGNMSYEEVSDRIKQQLEQRAQQEALSSLAEELKANADIVYE